MFHFTHTTAQAYMIRAVSFLFFLFPPFTFSNIHWTGIKSGIVFPLIVSYVWLGQRFRRFYT